ncbi:MAG TPA: XdhC family protein [Longimicrobiales bacterium]|nr:XdhC family protein [Longimicrobiales bacterium]
MSADLDVYRAVVAARNGSRRTVVATVVATRGSVPRRAGSRMAIDIESGVLVGTIGGGCGEGDVIAAARDVAREGRPRLLRVELMDPVDSWSPAVCGGVMEVLLEPVGQ